MEILVSAAVRRAHRERNARGGVEEPQGRWRRWRQWRWRQRRQRLEQPGRRWWWPQRPERRWWPRRRWWRWWPRRRWWRRRRRRWEGRRGGWTLLLWGRVTFFGTGRARVVAWRRVTEADELLRFIQRHQMMNETSGRTLTALLLCALHLLAGNYPTGQLKEDLVGFRRLVAKESLRIFGGSSMGWLSFQRPQRIPSGAGASSRISERRYPIAFKGQ